MKRVQLLHISADFMFLTCHNPGCTHATTKTQSGASGESATQRLSCDGFHRALAQLGPGVAIVTNWEWPTPPLRFLQMRHTNRPAERQGRLLIWCLCETLCNMHVTTVPRLKTIPIIDTLRCNIMVNFFLSAWWEVTVWVSTGFSVRSTCSSTHCIKNKIVTANPLCVFCH